MVTWTKVPVSRGNVKWLDSGNISDVCQQYVLMDWM